MITSLNLYGQDLFSIENSAKYADYLYRTANFKTASLEYERLIFLDSTNSKYHYRLVTCYRRTTRFQMAIDYIKHIYCDSAKLPEQFAIELLNSSILNKNPDSIFGCFGKIELKDCHLNAFYNGLRNIYSENFIGAEKSLMTCSTPSASNQQLYNALLDFKNYKDKSPFLAFSMSAIIPGSGKIYTGYWKDGLIAFSFVTLTAWQSYKGFSKKGSRSVYGWLYGTASLSFYIGNLFGSGKSAHMHNLHRKQDLFNETDKIFHTYID